MRRTSRRHTLSLPGTAMPATLRFTRSLVVALLPFLALACGGPPLPKKSPVSGKVTLDGKPLPSRLIAFRGKDHPPIGGAITDGKFECFAHPGHVKVEIRAYRTVKRDMSVPGMS